LFQRQPDALAAVERLSASGWRVLLTESVGRGEYERRSKPTAIRQPDQSKRSGDLVL